MKNTILFSIVIVMFFAVDSIAQSNAGCVVPSSAGLNALKQQKQLLEQNLRRLQDPAEKRHRLSQAWLLGGRNGPGGSAAAVNQEESAMNAEIAHNLSEQVRVAQAIDDREDVIRKAAADPRCNSAPR